MVTGLDIDDNQWSYVWHPYLVVVLFSATSRSISIKHAYTLVYKYKYFMQVKALTKAARVKLINVTLE